MKSPHHVDREGQDDSIDDYICYRTSHVEGLRMNASGLNAVVPIATDRMTGENVDQEHRAPPPYY